MRPLSKDEMGDFNMFKIFGRIPDWVLTLICLLLVVCIPIALFFSVLPFAYWFSGLNGNIKNALCFSAILGSGFIFSFLSSRINKRDDGGSAFLVGVVLVFCWFALYISPHVIKIDPSKVLVRDGKIVEIPTTKHCHWRWDPYVRGAKVVWVKDARISVGPEMVIVSSESKDFYVFKEARKLWSDDPRLKGARLYYTSRQIVTGSRQIDFVDDNGLLRHFACKVTAKVATGVETRVEFFRRYGKSERLEDIVGQEIGNMIVRSVKKPRQILSRIDSSDDKAQLAAFKKAITSFVVPVIKEKWGDKMIFQGAQVEEVFP